VKNLEPYIALVLLGLTAGRQSGHRLYMSGGYMIYGQAVSQLDKIVLNLEIFKIIYRIKYSNFCNKCTVLL